MPPKVTNKARREAVLPTTMALADLWAVIERKCRRLKLTNPLGTRGTLVPRLVSGAGGDLLFVMEAGYHSTLYPRLVYRFPEMGSNGHEGRIRDALRAERREPLRLVAQRDTRLAVTLTWFDSTLDERPALDHNGNGPPYARDVSIARAQRQVQDAEQRLVGAQEWLARAMAMAPEAPNADPPPRAAERLELP